MDLGAVICLPRNPKCGLCPVKRFCRAPNPETLPLKKPRLKTQRLVENHAFIANRTKILLEQATKRWRGMWMLPQMERTPVGSPIHMSIFPFTNHRITLRLFRRDAHKIDNRKQRWFSFRDLASIPIPSPHRRAIEQQLRAA